MKNVFKILGILCIIAAAVFITACPPGEEEETFTVKFTGDGIEPFTKTVPKDKTLTQPVVPTYVLQEGLYLNLSSPVFSGWKDADGDTYDWTKPVTEDFTLTASWSTTAPTPISLTGSGDIVAKAISKVNEAGSSGTFTLILAGNVTAGESVQLKKNELIIKSNNAWQRTITAFTPSSGIPVYLTVGPKRDEVASTTNNPKLTLASIILQGNGTATNDSMVLVSYGATLTMERDAQVTGHINNTDAMGNNAGGAKGNGSAVCVYSGTLNMKAGSWIHDNKSTGSNTNGNRNLVGGVYSFVASKTYPVTLNIEGGEITENYCTTGNTKDLYATEGGEFILSKGVTIGELTINADTYPTTSDPVTPATIIVFGLENPVGSLSLRSTQTSIASVQSAWVGKYVLRGKPNQGSSTPTNVLPDDLNKFTLGDFKAGNVGENNAANGFAAIGSAYSIDTDGKLKKN